MTLPPKLSWWPLLPTNGMVAARGLPAILKSKNIEPLYGQLTTQILVRYVGLVLGAPSIEEVKLLTQEGFKWLYWYGILPSWKHPRWFLPLVRRKVATEGLCMYSPQRWYTRLAKKMLNNFISMRLPWPGPCLLIALRQPSSFVEACAKWTGIPDLYLSFSSGTPGPFRKVTIQAVGTNGYDRAYIKIAAMEGAKERIENEARVLATLNADQKYRRFTPKLLFSGVWNGLPLLAQSALAGHPGPVHLKHQLWYFLESLIGEERVPIFALSFTKTLDRQVSSYPFLIPFWKNIKSSLNESLIPKTIMHGDFVPWNVRYDEYGLSVFDWESSDLEGIPLYDVFNYILQHGFLVKRWSVDEAMNKLRKIFLSVPFNSYIDRASLGLKDTIALLRCYLLYRLLDQENRRELFLRVQYLAFLKALENINAL